MNIFDPFTRVQNTPTYLFLHLSANDLSQSTTLLSSDLQKDLLMCPPLSTQLQIVAAIQATYFQ